jgi:hypothetical protein
VNSRLDALAHNALASALFQGMKYQENLIKMVFLDPASREFFPDWEENASSMVAHLRAVAGTDPNNSSFFRFVEELSAASDDFREMWDRHDVRVKTNEFVRLRHREVGDVTFWHETFSIDSAPGQRLFVGLPEPGSPSEYALARLYMLTASQR